MKKIKKPEAGNILLISVFQPLDGRYKTFLNDTPQHAAGLFFDKQCGML